MAIHEFRQLTSHLVYTDGFLPECSVHIHLAAHGVHIISRHKRRILQVLHPFIAISSSFAACTKITEDGSLQYQAEHLVRCTLNTHSSADI